jgi:hypothetical protein
MSRFLEAMGKKHDFFPYADIDHLENYANSPF